MNTRAKRSIIWKIPKEELQSLCDKCGSITKVLDSLGMLNKGNNYQTLKKRITQDKISLEQLKANRVIKIRKDQIPLEEILVKNSTYNRSHLKRRLFANGMLKNQCYECGQLPIWNNKPLVLELDHKNGISNDNRLENLRILCGHCHSQTTNYAGKCR